MRRPPEPRRIVSLGRASLDPNRPDPMHKLGVNETMADNVTTAKKTGVYLTNGVPQRFKEGDVLPDGAELRKEQPAGDALLVTPRQEEKAVIAEADEQRARGRAPENRSK
jgi:hypothetical protein